MNPFTTGGIGLALTSHARPQSEEQGACSRATGSGTLMKFLCKLMKKNITFGVQSIMRRSARKLCYEKER